MENANFQEQFRGQPLALLSIEQMKRGVRGPSDSTVVRALAFHAANSGLIPGALYGPLILPGVSPECSQ